MSEIPHLFGLPAPEPLPINPLRAAFGREEDWRTSGLRHLAELVGGIDALEALDAVPHPDEPFDWAEVRDPQRDAVGRVLDRIEAGVKTPPIPALAEFEAKLEADLGRRLPPRVDVESVTIARRLLRRIALHRPETLLRPAPERTAAAIVWLVLRANGNLGRRAPVGADQLWRMFGVSSAADRWRLLLDAAGLPLVDPNPMSGGRPEPWLPDAALLHSRQRGYLIQRRDANVKLFEADRERRERARPVRPHPNGIEVRGPVVRPRWAHVGVADGGRVFVAIALGESDADADAGVIMLNIPDARALIGMLSRAVDGPLPRSVGRRGSGTN